jgi:hypothetical protein
MFESPILDFGIHRVLRDDRLVFRATVPGRQFLSVDVVVLLGVPAPFDSVSTGPVVYDELPQ